MDKKNRELNMFIVAILYFFLGSIFVVATTDLVKSFNYLLVCICFIIGVVQILSFILNKKYLRGEFSDLFIGMIFIWLSLVLYVYYGFTINILPILFSLYLFYIFSDLISKCFKVDKVLRKRYIILAIIAFVVGVLLIFNPFGSILIYLKITGIYMLILSITLFFSFVRELKK